jgi:hypothetical protein
LRAEDEHPADPPPPPGDGNGVAGQPPDDGNTDPPPPPDDGNGAAAQPLDLSKSFTVKDLASPPDPTWTIDQLNDYERHHYEQFIMLGKRKAVHLYRLGEALMIAKGKCEHGEWGKYLKSLGISEATASRARALVKLATSIEAVTELGITEAYIEYGILKSNDAESDEDAISGKKETAKKNTASRKKRKTQPKVAKNGSGEDETGDDDDDEDIDDDDTDDAEEGDFDEDDGDDADADDETGDDTAEATRRIAALKLLDCFDSRSNDPDFNPGPDDPPAPESIPAAIAYLIENYFVGGWAAALNWMETQRPAVPEGEPQDGVPPPSVGAINADGAGVLVEPTP